MNILKNVINKLSQEEKKEVNLASEKVELALVDDIAKALKASDDLIDGSQQQIDFAKKVAQNRKLLLDDLPKAQKEANRVFEQGAKFLSNAQDVAADLGLKTSNIKNYDKLEKNLNQLAREIDGIITAIRSLK